MDQKQSDKSSLLNQLKIDRNTSAPTQSRSPWPWLSALLIIAVIAGGSAYWFLYPRGIPVSVAMAESYTQEGAPRGASTLDASGYIVARRQATVASKFTGRVMEVLIEEGQAVAKDEIIARLDDSNSRIALLQAQAQLAQAEANLASAKNAFENALPIYERNQKLIEQKMISALAFDNAKASYDATRMAKDVAAQGVAVAKAALAAAQQNHDDTIIRAPFAGVVTVKAAQAGETVSPVSAGGGFTRTGICTIVDMNSLELEVDVSENFINRVSANQAAIVRLNAYSDWEIPARVIAVIPTADQAKATVKVRIGFEEQDARILPEMGARVSFLESQNTNEGQATTVSSAVLVPNNAVQAKNNTGVVYVIDGNTVERRAVSLGGKTRDGHIVLSGLRPGNQLAVGDFNVLTDRAKIQIIQ